MRCGKTGPPACSPIAGAFSFFFLPRVFPLDILEISFLVLGIPATLLTAVYAHSMVLYARGDLAQQKGQFDLALQRFRQAAQGINPIGRGVAYAGMARTYLKVNQPDEAVAALRETVVRAKSPPIILAAYQLFADAALHPSLKAKPADVLLEAEKLILATGMATTIKAVALGQFAGAWYRLADAAQSSRVADLALQNDKLNTTALFSRGWMDLAEGNLVAAREHFTTLMNVNQADQKPLGRYGLAMANFVDGKWNDAVTGFSESAKAGGKLLEPFAWARQSMAQNMNGQYGADALSSAERAVTELRGRGSLSAQSNINWLLAMARAYHQQNLAAATAAAESAPAEEKAEALWHAQRLAGNQTPGWNRREAL